ncbi:hypothetical protein [Paraburkholderia rhizosphaerae]|nr:hypothetical protein [Paraburkholderia rhizosphaerae]
MAPATVERVVRTLADNPSMSYYAVSKSSGVNEHTVERFAVAHGLERRAPRTSRESTSTGKEQRIVQMLTEHRSMSYYSVAVRCNVAHATVRRVALAHHLQRDVRPQLNTTRIHLFDDFVHLPAATVSDLAKRHGLSATRVRTIRSEFQRVRQDWDAVRVAERVQGGAEPHAPLSEAARSFVRNWGRLISSGNLSTIMDRPQAEIDAYMHSDEYGQAVPAPATARWTAPSAASQPDQQATAQPDDASHQGPSARPLPLTEWQQAEIRRWGGEGMLPDSLALYLEVPEEQIRAYMGTGEYLNHVRSVPRTESPDAG